MRESCCQLDTEQGQCLPEVMGDGKRWLEARAVTDKDARNGADGRRRGPIVWVEVR